MIFKSWDKHTETWCRIAFMLMIPSALSRVFATICIIFGFVLLAIIRKGYEEYWHLDDADKEKYHELMALLMAINDDFEGMSTLFRSGRDDCLVPTIQDVACGDL